MQGNTGAASTVKEWKDFRDGKVFPSCSLETRFTAWN